MKEIRFRNHFSVVFERMGGLIAVVVLLRFQNVNNISEMIDELKSLKYSSGTLEVLVMLLAPLGVIMIAIIIIAWQINIWHKTWVTISDETITEERNTINKMCNTIGLKNVSNVNLEQSFWEKILGTCKVKLDTNSLSTANHTDVKIILKKTEAQRIQREILTRVNAAQNINRTSDKANSVYKEDTQQEEVIENNVQQSEDNKYDFIATGQDIFHHGLCCISISTILVLIGCITGVVAAFAELGNNLTGSMLSLVANFVVFAGIIFSCLKGLLGGFITYYDFKIGRRGDKLHIHYGLFRTIDYTIPVSKINGVIIRQTLIGRLSHKYMVELVNVGMGDEKEEAGSYIILACNREQLQRQLELLLPEYMNVPIEQIKRQPKAVIYNKVVKTIILGTVIVITGVIMTQLIPEIKIWMMLLACGAMIAYGILLAVLNYKTAGSYFDKNQMLVANGCFRRDISVLPYENIQYFKLQTNVVLNHFGLVEGNAMILASIQNQVQRMPVCDAEKLEEYVQKNYIGI